MANFSVETVGKLYASGRNLVSTAVGLIGGIGLMSAAQSKGMMDALQQIYDGIALIVSGSTSLWNILLVAFPIIGGLMAKYASNSAKTDNQAAAVTAAIKDTNTPISIETKAAVLESVANIEEVKTPVIKVADPVLAELVPSDKIKATTP